ncbi:ABC transporter ATP-binding protein [Pseudonocardia pini]|uniref:ABC transporter ATP-binding protein n=1 Tax=Pseudonocardia pini TaxID=2758030 RepID=UPI0015F02592|nr:ABC transporter ATP-binding protein [Pseudonocardia pini]
MTLISDTSAGLGAADATTGPAVDSLLAVEGLTVTYGDGGPDDVTALSDVDLRVAPGERVAVVGESGSGKSTLGLAIAGFLGADVAVTSSRLSFADTDLRTRPVTRIPAHTPGLSMMFQDAMTSLDPVWTVGSQLRDAVRATGRSSRREIRDRTEEWLHRVGLTDTARVLDARPYELSGGMRQRVMLAVALAARPRLLIADEPTSALDASLSRDVMDLLASLTAEDGTALIMITHDLHLAAEYVHRVVVMLHGRVVDDVPAATLAESATDPYTRGLLACVPTLDSADLHRLPTLGDLREREEAA